MSTTTHPDANSNGVHPSAIGSNTKPSSQSDLNGSSENKSPTEPEGGYPEQLHAGAVGYGPEYGRNAGFTEKITGLKEEAKGKITRNHGLVQQGKDRRTGELKKKQQEEEDAKSDPFATAGGDKKDDKKDDVKDTQPHSEAPDSPEDDATSDDKSTHETTTHSNQDERAEKEQAATVAPEGTQTAEGQRRGEAVEDVKNI